MFLKNELNHNKGYPCLNCLVSYSSQNVLDAHQRICVEHKEAEATFPKDEYAYFKNYNYKNKVPFVVYADFEAWNKISEKTTQEPLAFGIYILSEYPNLMKSEYIEFMTGDGESCIPTFVNLLINLQDKFYNLLHVNYPINMNEEDELNFQNAVNCYYCNRELKDDRVRDHDHYKANNNYRGASHQSCNLELIINLYLYFFIMDQNMIIIYFLQN